MPSTRHPAPVPTSPNILSLLRRPQLLNNPLEPLLRELILRQEAIRRHRQLVQRLRRHIHIVKRPIERAQRLFRLQCARVRVERAEQPACDALVVLVYRRWRDRAI